MVLGRLVIPPGEIPTLRKSSIPTTPVSLSRQSFQAPLTSGTFNILGNSSTSTPTPTSLPSPVTTASMLPNGNKSYSVPIDVENYKVSFHVHTCFICEKNCK